MQLCFVKKHSGKGFHAVLYKNLLETQKIRHEIALQCCYFYINSVMLIKILSPKNQKQYTFCHSGLWHHPFWYGYKSQCNNGWSISKTEQCLQRICNENWPPFFINGVLTNHSHFTVDIPAKYKLCKQTQHIVFYKKALTLWLKIQTVHSFLHHFLT